MSYALKLSKEEIKFLNKTYSPSFSVFIDWAVYQWNYFGQKDYWHSHSKFATELNCSPTTVKKNIKLAVDLGFMETNLIEQNGSHVTSYHLNINFIKSFFARGLQILKQVGKLTRAIISTVRQELDFFIDEFKKALFNSHLRTPPLVNEWLPYNIEYENIRKNPDIVNQGLEATAERDPEPALEARSVSPSPVRSEVSKQESIPERPSAALGERKHVKIWIDVVDLDGLSSDYFRADLVELVNKRINDALNASILTTTNLSQPYRSIPLEILYQASVSKLKPLESINNSIGALVRGKWLRPTGMPEPFFRPKSTLKEIFKGITNTFSY